MKSRKRTITIVAVLMGSMFLAGSVWATDAESIMSQIDEKQITTTAQSRMVMRIHPVLGSATNVREFRIENYSRGSEDSYIVFVAPQSIRGLRVLEAGNDTRVYFPSTGRIRRITGDQQSGSVGGVGGDFSYEDMGGGSYTEDFELAIERETNTEWVIRGVPTDPDSSYTHVRFFVEKANVRVTKVEYFTAEDGHTKTLTMDNYRVSDGVEMATNLRMVNHAENQETIVEVVAFRANIPIDEKYFNPNRFYR